MVVDNRLNGWTRTALTEWIGSPLPPPTRLSINMAALLAPVERWVVDGTSTSVNFECTVYTSRKSRGNIYRGRSVYKRSNFELMHETHRRLYVINISRACTHARTYIYVYVYIYVHALFGSNTYIDIYIGRNRSLTHKIQRPSLPDERKRYLTTPLDSPSQIAYNLQSDHSCPPNRSSAKNPGKKSYSRKTYFFEL